MGQFGIVSVFDHPFLAFPMPGGNVLRLPCGTVPTALIEKGLNVTEVWVLMSGIPPLIWTVALPVEHVQEIFADGARRLNRMVRPPVHLEMIPPLDKP